jgi:glycosyltransferase involved in cell wall biosynthesis
MAPADLSIPTTAAPRSERNGAGLIPELTLFVACFNEAPDIVPTLETVVAAVDEVACSYEIIVIDDASTDGSREVVRAYQAAHPHLPIRLQVNRANQGLARNFIEAARLGRGRLFRLVCGDNVESKETLLRILRQRGTADLVLPYHVKAEGRSRTRLLLSHIFTRLVNFLGGHSIRYYNGMPLCLRAHVTHWDMRTTGFGFQAELVTHLLDQKIRYCEVGVEARERTHGKSRALTLHNFAAVGCSLLRIGLRRLRKLAVRPR